MSQSLSKLYIHLIFHIKNGGCSICPENETELYSYMGSLLKISKSIPIVINGTENHVHILCIMSKTTSLANIAEDVKKNSSRWIKSRGSLYCNFEWQRGYSGFSVSQSKVEVVRRYILNQREHHKKFSFEEEYVRFLKEYNIDYDEKFLWT
jgi:REP element-mobilizing transposase RayT